MASISTILASTLFYKIKFPQFFRNFQYKKRLTVADEFTEE